MNRYFNGFYNADKGFQEQGLDFTKESIKIPSFFKS